MARIKLVIPEKIHFTAYLQVRISDINYGNHAGNDAIVSMLHEARVQYLKTGGYTELNLGGAALIMGDLAVEYKNESFYGDALSVNIYVDNISEKSFELYYVITCNRNGENIVIAKAKTGMVCFNYEEKKIANMPELFRKYLSGI